MSDARVIRTAGMSVDQRMRYTLSRRWDHRDGADFDARHTGRYVNFVMLNPSTADAARDDATIRRCIAFARSWGYGGVIVSNLFALRATVPNDLLAAADRGDGAENDTAILGCAAQASLIVCAWGSWGGSRPLAYRTSQVARMFGLVKVSLYCLGLTRSTLQPRHPLYVPASCKLERFVSPL